MKELALMAVTTIVVSSAFCGNKAVNVAKAQQDSTRIADPIAVVEVAAAEAEQAVAQAVNSLSADSIVTEAVAK